MPISIDEVVTEIAPPPAPAGETAAGSAAPNPIAPDSVTLARLLDHLAWRAARVAAD